MQTYDGMLHRMNIIDNHYHTVVDTKNGLEFIINNSGREYIVNNKGAKTIDYELIDRIIKGIAIDTKKFQKLYNRLIYRQ